MTLDAMQDGDPNVVVAVFLIYAEDTSSSARRYSGAQHPPTPAEEGDGPIRHVQRPGEEGAPHATDLPRPRE
jgi:hypothetical protein